MQLRHFISYRNADTHRLKHCGVKHTNTAHLNKLVKNTTKGECFSKLSLNKERALTSKLFRKAAFIEGENRISVSHLALNDNLFPFFTAFAQ